MKFTDEQRKEVERIQKQVSGLAPSLRKLFDIEERLTENRLALHRLDLSKAADALDAADQALKRVLARQPE